MRTESAVIPKPLNDEAAVSRSVGFPLSAGSAAVNRQTPAKDVKAARVMTNGAPTGKRPKGRWFISLLILAICGTVASGLWNEFVRFQSYGTIQGRVIQLSAPWSGVIQTLHVKDGEYVTQGQLLATLDNTELNLQLGKLQDDMRLARAALETRVAELKATQREHAERSMRVHVDYFELLSRLYQETARLDELRSAHARIERLGSQNAVAQIDVDAAAFTYQGQQKRVSELREAVKQMKRGLREASLSDTDKRLLNVEKTRIETVMTQWERLIGYERRGDIRAPSSGRIVRRHHFTGEFVGTSDTVFELLEEGSIRAVLYLPQHKTKRIKNGQRTKLSVPPNRGSLTFEIERVGDEMSPAPACIRRYYRPDQRLVPVFCKPMPGQLRDTQGDESIWLGAEVRLPRFSL